MLAIANENHYHLLSLVIKQYKLAMSYNNLQSEQRVIVIAQDQIGPQRVASSCLLGKEGKLAITHCDELYMLRLTRNGKLILTK